MMGPTHELGGFTAGLGAAALLTSEGQVAEGAVLATASVLTSRLPDVDLALGGGPDHRSMTHSLAFAGVPLVVGAFLLLSALGLDVTGSLSGGGIAAVGGGSGEAILGIPLTVHAALVMGLVVGYLSHLVLDSLTPKGIFLLTPDGPRIGLRFIDTDSSGETFFYGLLIVAIAVTALITFPLSLGALVGGVAVIALDKLSDSKYLGGNAERLALIACLALVGIQIFVALGL